MERAKYEENYYFYVKTNTTSTFYITFLHKICEFLKKIPKISDTISFFAGKGGCNWVLAGSQSGGMALYIRLSDRRGKENHNRYVSTR